MAPQGRFAAGAALAGAVGAAGAVYAIGLGRAANYDEGVYLASLVELRHGAALGGEVFASQPPGFYLLLRGIGVVAGTSVDGVRLGFLLLALGGLVAAFALGRALAGPWAGVGAAAVLAVAAPYPTQAAQVEAETPALVLALTALALAAAARRRPAAWLPLAAGACLAAATSVKLLALTALVPLVALSLPGRRGRRLGLAAAGGATVAALFLIGYAGVLGELWSTVVRFHSDARGIDAASLGDNLRRIVRFPDPRTPFGWLVPAGAAASLAARARGRPLGTGPLWLWAAVSAVYLVWQRPLHDHHTVLLAVALGTAAGASLGAVVARLEGRAATVAAGVLSLFVAAGFVQEARRLERNGAGEPAEVRWAVERLRAETPANALVVTDLPIVAVRAHRRVPGRLVDTSAVRLASGYLTRAEVLAAARDADAAVAAREFRADPELLAGLGALFPRRLTYPGVTVFLP